MNKESSIKVDEIILSEGNLQKNQPIYELTEIKEGGVKSAERYKESLGIGAEKWNKSRRGQQNTEAKEITEFFVDDEGHKWIKPKKPEWLGYAGESIFLLI